jgi:hypothetical protein
MLLDIANVTNASPAVVTTTDAHGLLTGAVAKIADVLGSTGVNGLWRVTGLSPTAFSVPVAAGGAYAGGGTVRPFGAVRGIVEAISEHVVAVLAAKSLPPLVDGKVLLGRQHLFEASSPPRVVFIPIDGDCVIGESRVVSAGGDTMRLQNIERALGAQEIHFEVHVWGQADPPDPDDDFDATKELADQVLRTSALAAPGSVRAFRVGPMWPDQAASATQLVKAGHEVVFGLAFSTTLLDESLLYVPTGTTANPTFGLIPPQGGPPEAP